MIQLDCQELFDWVTQQPDDREIVMGQCLRNSSYTVGCVLMQFAESKEIDCDHASYHELNKNGVRLAIFPQKSRSLGLFLSGDFVVACNRGKCINYGDAKRILEQFKIEQGIT